MLNMKYLLLVLAVAAVFADPFIYTSFEDNQQEEDKLFEDNQQEIEDKQQEIKTLNIEGDDSRHPAIVSASTPLYSMKAPTLVDLINSVIERKLASQPGKSKTYKLIISMIVHLIYMQLCRCFIFLFHLVVV